MAPPPAAGRPATVKARRSSPPPGVTSRRDEGRAAPRAGGAAPDSLPYPWRGIDLDGAVERPCGRIRFDLQVTRHGRLRNVRVDESSFPAPETVAIAAIVRRTPFRPAFRGGKAVDAAVPFELVLSGAGGCRDAGEAR